MNLLLADRIQGQMSRRLLLAPPQGAGALLLENHHLSQVAVMLPPPGESPMFPVKQLVERARVMTGLMEEILSRAEAVPHGGINE